MANVFPVTLPVSYLRPRSMQGSAEGLPGDREQRVTRRRYQQRGRFHAIPGKSGRDRQHCTDWFRSHGSTWALTIPLINPFIMCVIICAHV